MATLCFLMDPLDTVDSQKDTSFAFMLASHELGHDVFYVPKGGVSYQDTSIGIRGVQVVPNRALSPTPFDVLDSKILSQDDIDLVFIRTDPPFDSNYLMSTWLLDLLGPKVKVVNSPRGLQSVNEKIWALQFKELVPKTLVTRHIEDYLAFLENQKKVVVKPANGFGGQSIFIVDKNSDNKNVIFETISKDGSEEIIVQDYLEEAKNGDKRILLLDGVPLGAIKRIHSDSDHRNNVMAGGRTELSEITDHDQMIIDIISPQLNDLGLRFVGIDVISDKLIEVNVTSPTCIQEMSETLNEDLAKRVISKLTA